MNQNEIINAVKNCYDKFRTDDGLNSSKDYLENLSWILYLKFLEALELENKQQRKLQAKPYTFLIDKKYRWSEWATQKEYTGKRIIHFVNKKLFPYLRKINNSSTQIKTKKTISLIFQNCENNVRSGYILKEVVNLIDKLEFKNKDIFILSEIYEDLLKTLTKDGGDAGQFYTPRPLIKAMVKVTGLKVGDKIYDPACGTGGFLIQAVEALKPKIKNTQQLKKINQSIYGREKTKLPYFLCLMNLNLHEIDCRYIEQQNTLRKDIRDIDDNDLFDVILANPPFGGKEEKMIQKNFPYETAETGILFLQHIEKSLASRGKAAVVLSEGHLHNRAYEKVRKSLLESSNVHSVLSLPQGTFYKNVKTSVIFFDKKTKKSKNVWFYDLPLLDNKKLTHKNNPISEKHFEEFIDLYPKRKITKHSWLTSKSKIFKNNCILSASIYKPEKEKEKLKAPKEYLEEFKKYNDEIITSIKQLESEV